MKLFLLTLLLAICPFVCAQQIRHLGVDNGLNGRQAYNFQQDKKGFIWISTRFGIDRYDGNKIKNYPLQILDRRNYPTRVFKVMMDRNSELWAYANRGSIYRYNEMKDCFDLYKNLESYLRCTYFDYRNKLWIAAKSDIGFLEKDSLQMLNSTLLSSLEIKSFSDFDKRNFLVVTNKDILKFNPENQEFSSVFDDVTLGKISGIDIESAYYEPDNQQLWIGTVRSGVYLYRIRDMKLTLVSGTQLFQNPILTVSPFDEFRLFVGTDGAGAWLIDKERLMVIRSYRQEEGLDFPLNGDGIYDIFRDRDGRIWMATYSDGVNILDFSRQGFQIIRHEKNNPNSLPKDIVSGILEDNSGNLWFASNNGVSLLNNRTGEWKHFLSGRNVLTVYQDSRGKIWVGTHSSGVYQINEHGRILKHFFRQEERTDCLGTNFIYTIFEDIQGNIWFGGKKGRISKYEMLNDRFIQFPLSQINCIVQKNEKQIFVATEHGVYEFDMETNVHRSCDFSLELKSRYICDMYRESDSIFWFAGYGAGLIRCNIQTGRMDYFGKEKGLASDIVYALLTDNEGNFWISTENGISKLNPKTGVVTNFTEGDGLSGNRFRQTSKTKTNSGILYFGSYTGVTFFDPAKIILRKNSSSLVLLNFSLFNKISLPGEENSPLVKPLDDTEEIRMDYTKHSFSLNFTTIEFSPGYERKYLWKLEGLDPDWIGPTSENVVNYTNLSPQTYIFKVKAIDGNNEVLDERSLKIVITPPFWKTTWAWMLFLALFTGIAYWIYLYVRNRYEKQQTEEKIRFFINTTHDIRTPLTLISAPLYELKEKLELNSWNKYLIDLITCNLDSINKMISQLLDFQKVYESKEQTAVSKWNVNNYLVDRVMYWKPVAIQKHLDLDLELPEVQLFEWFDGEKMDKILSNLISNAIKYTPSRGHIKVSLSLTPNFWQITVKDDGIGITQKEKKYLFKRFFRADNAVNSQATGSGLGLLLVKEYVHLHGGEIGVNSIENKGSEFFIRFKHGSDHFKDSVLLDNANLPIVPENALPEAEDSMDKMKIKLLIVEDNKDLKEYLKLSLSHYYKTFAASNGKEAWEQIFSVNPDMIVSDLNMPEMNGLVLCEKVKSTFETSHIPVILLTVLTDKKKVEEGLKTGADDYILKPFDVQYLKIKIDNIINNRKILRSKFLDVDKSDSDESGENKFSREFIQKSTAIIEEHMMDSKFSISDFSKEMGMSRSLLYTKFNSITGYSPNDFIKIVRMKKAIQLFREKKYSINEVACMTGFDEPGYFATCFRKIYGKSPRRFIEDDL